jgi:hypothetical protein
LVNSKEWNTMVRIRILPSLTLLLAGCGGNEFSVAPVRGTVLCEGQPVPPGTITFAPVAAKEGAIPGKVATGQVTADGKFVLTTYEKDDGAIIGSHVVSYAPHQAGEGQEVEEGDEGTTPAATTATAKPRPKGKRPPCQVGGQAKAEVAAGENDLKIDLSNWRPGANEDDDSRAER